MGALFLDHFTMLAHICCGSQEPNTTQTTHVVGFNHYSPQNNYALCCCNITKDSLQHLTLSWRHPPIGNKHELAFAAGPRSLPPILHPIKFKTYSFSPKVTFLLGIQVSKVLAIVYFIVFALLSLSCQVGGLHDDVRRC